MKFEVVGPFFIKTPSIIKIDDIKQLKLMISENAAQSSLLAAPGCYVFGIKSTGSKRVVPWYVGKSEKQSVFKEATNAAHLQVYNEILDTYKKGHPALIFLPQITSSGAPSKVAKGDAKKPAIEFLEDWLIAAALRSNPDLYNIKKTKMLNELWVRGLFNATQGDSNAASKALKASLKL
ncbi:hypothetical protein [Rhodoferax sp.]|uniref:hypothetical protein n=1 Tax=Rhodoferax sp. TaxID=50421 RepID=UPI0025FE9846|nr:hypothetical protein [Rhodoferax sp.]